MVDNYKKIQRTRIGADLNGNNRDYSLTKVVI